MELVKEPLYVELSAVIDSDAEKIPKAYIQKCGDKLPLAAFGRLSKCNEANPSQCVLVVGPEVESHSPSQRCGS